MWWFFSFLSNFTPFILFSFVQNVLMWSKEYDTELCIRFVVWFVFFYFRSYSFSGCSFCFVICDTKPVECICDMMANRYKSGKSNAKREKKKSTKQLQLKLLKLLLLLHKIAIGYCPFVVFFFVHISVICIAMHTVTAAAAVVFHFLNSCLFLF